MIPIASNNISLSTDFAVDESYIHAEIDKGDWSLPN